MDQSQSNASASPEKEPQKVMTRSQLREQFPDLESDPEVIVTKDGTFTIVDDPTEE